MKRKHKVILSISLLINIVGIIVAALLFVRIGGFDYFSNEEVPYNENPYYVERTDLFNGVELAENSTIFIGDSITQRGLWNELFPEENVINRGVNSDTTEGVKNRLDDIVSSNPEKVFLMIGINDLYAEKTTDEIVSNYEDILNQFKSESPNTKVYVQSVLPLNYEMYYAGDKIKNETIKDLNKELKNLSTRFNYTFIDLYSKFEKNGQLNKQLSYDGIHLSGEGYNVWKESIEKYIQ